MSRAAGESGRPAEGADAPLGALVTDTSPAGTPRRRHYEGRFVRLSPVDPANDLEELFAGAHGGPGAVALWTYLPYGPFGDRNAMGEWLGVCAESRDPLFFTVHALESAKRVGMVSFLNMVPAMRTMELGHIWYQPQAQRGPFNTEAVYLMLCEAFEAQRCRRVEWKCNALNARSRAAALRLGFSFEGVFRQHLIVKGRNRDSAWFSMLDHEWPAVRANMLAWLYATGPRPSLRALNAGIVENPAPG